MDSENTDISRVMLPVFNDSIDRSTGLGYALAAAFNAEIILVQGVLTGPSGSERDPIPDVRANRKLAERLFSLREDLDHEIPTSGVIRRDETVEDLVAAAAREYAPDITVLDVDSTTETEAEFTEATVTTVGERTSSDILGIYGTGRIDDVDEVLVAIGTGPHSDLAAMTAGVVAQANDATVEVLHIISPDASRDERIAGRELLNAAEAIFNTDAVETRLIDHADPAEAILQEAEHCDLLGIGAPDSDRLRRFIFGSTTDEVVSEAAHPVLVTWRSPTSEE